MERAALRIERLERTEAILHHQADRWISQNRAIQGMIMGMELLEILNGDPRELEGK